MTKYQRYKNYAYECKTDRGRIELCTYLKNRGLKVPKQLINKETTGWRILYVDQQGIINAYNEMAHNKLKYISKTLFQSLLLYRFSIYGEKRMLES